LERLEANRVGHLAAKHVLMGEAAIAAERRARKDDILRRLLISKSFALSQRISKLARRGTPAFTEDELRRALRDD
jgi:hypothetical protein